MIDIHCHILPGVDDGAQNMGTAIAMAEMAQRNGIRGIIATPHCNRDFFGQNLFTRELMEEFERLNRAILREGLHVRIYPGMEIMVTDAFPQLLAQGRLLPLAGSRYLLVEFAFDCAPALVHNTIRSCLVAGYTPVIAHPERYFCAQSNPELAVAWNRSGAVLQLNRGSLQGRLSAQAQACAWRLIEREAAGVVASDAHGIEFRRVELDSILHEIAQSFSWACAAKLLIDNPRRILKNEAFDSGFPDIRLPD